MSDLPVLCGGAVAVKGAECDHGSRKPFNGRFSGPLLTDRGIDRRGTQANHYYWWRIFGSEMREDDAEEALPGILRYCPL